MSEDTVNSFVLKQMNKYYVLQYHQWGKTSYNTGYWVTLIFISAANYFLAVLFMTINFMYIVPSETQKVSYNWEWNTKRIKWIKVIESKHNKIQRE